MQAALRERSDSLGILAFLWALAILYHELAYRLLEPSRADVVLIGLALAVLVAPCSLALFASLLVVQLVELWQRLPFVANHWFFEAIVSLTLLAALGREVLRSWSVRAVGRERLFSDLAPVLRIQMLLLYAIAAFHKLNRDYLDPQVSCAVHIHRLIAARLPFYPSGPWVEEMAIPVSLLIEAGLPLLLLVPKTRLAGLVIGALFHLALSRSPFPPGTFSFGGMLLSLYALFLPAGAWAVIGERVVGRARVRGGVALAAGMTLVATRIGGNAGLVLYAAEALGFVAFLLSPAIGRLPRESASGLLRLPRPAFLVFPVLVLLNGMSPYFGLKTQTAFSMFSNLRTEGGATNHLLIARPLALSGYQEDLVTILRSSDPGLQRYANSGFRMAWFEFRDYASVRPALAVRYRRGGSLRDVARAGDDAELSAATPYLLRKLMLFRRVMVDAPVPCEH